MNINRIFSTKERIKILEKIIFKKNTIRVIELSKQLKLSKGLVSKYLQILMKEGIVSKIRGQMHVFESPSTKSARIFLTLNSVDWSVFKKFDFVKNAGIYGSSTKGTNNEDSDIDIWIRIGKADQHELAELTGILKKKDSRISVLFLTDEKIKIMKEKDSVFLHSLVFGTITLYGDELEI